MKTIKTFTIVLAAATLAACSEEPKQKVPTQAEIDAANARLWQFENKPIPKPREKKPGQF